MNDPRATLVTYTRRHRTVPLAVILIVGLGLRLVLLPTAGFFLDQVSFHLWGTRAIDLGLFGMYASGEITHPPLGVALMSACMWALDRLGGEIGQFNYEDNPALIIALKLPVLAFELALLSLVYYIVLWRAGLAWAVGVTVALTFTLGFLVVTAWWGQTDSIYTFFLVLSVYLLSRRQPSCAWAVYGLAWLAKFQSVMLLPIIVVLTLRRHGWRTLALSLVVFGVVFGGGMLPFVLGSGASAFGPFGSVGLFPYISAGAYNLWFWLSGSSEVMLLDSALFIGGLTYFQAGLILLSVGTAILSLRALLLPARDDDFLLAAAASIAFFMLPTRMQARYLYPGVVLLALAIAQSWKLVALYAALAVTFTYNILDVVWRGHGLLYYPYRLMPWKPRHNALMATLLAVVLLGIVLRPLWSREQWHSTSIARG